MKWNFHNRATADHIGLIPDFLSDFDPRSAAEQFNENYSNGGGWSSFGEGDWKLFLADSAMTGPYGASKLQYKNFSDEKHLIIAHSTLHSGEPDEELILIFAARPWVVIKPIAGDKFEVSRMD
ncbi:hypothetical protein M0Q28_06165 [Patescibacteria group bacterium]|jgi:hypothetical protein|nr:hypothetical protein [Patescibacteria group bacterium]